MQRGLNESVAIQLKKNIYIIKNYTKDTLHLRSINKDYIPDDVIINIVLFSFSYISSGDGKTISFEEIGGRERRRRGREEAET